MLLAEITTTNFAGVPDRTFTFRGEGGKATELILVTGRPGSGKTRLLHAILAAKEALGPYGRPHRLRHEARDPRLPVTIETVWQLDEVERASGSSTEQRVTVVDGEGLDLQPPRGLIPLLLKTYEHGIPTPKFDYFPAPRDLPSRPVGRTPRARSPLQERIARLSSARDKYDGLWGWLGDEAARVAREREGEAAERGVVFVDDASDGFSWLREGLAAFMDSPRFRRFDGKSGDLEFIASDGRTHGSDALSASARQMLLFVLAFEMVAHARSIVLIDTPELCQHPSEHARVLAGLRRLGGRSQIIAATQSRELLASGVSGTVVELK